MLILITMHVIKLRIVLFQLAISKSLHEDREQFCEIIHQLNAKCGLNNLYCKTREQEFIDEISTLEEQKQSLKSGSGYIAFHKVIYSSMYNVCDF